MSESNKAYNENHPPSAPAPLYNYRDINLDNIGNFHFPILIQSARIKQHGIPPLDNDKNCNDDNTKEFIKIPFDLQQPQCIEFKTHLDAMDAMFASGAMCQKLFGKRSNEYQYCPTVKTADDFVNDNDDDDVNYDFF